MRSTLDAFSLQVQNMEKVVLNKNKLTIGTLGPSGTSSEQSAMYIVRLLKKVNNGCEYNISLRNDFKEVLNDLQEGEIDYALVPSAYERVTDFFWHMNFSNTLNYIFETPDYGAISRTNFQVDSVDKVRIAMCPAVENVVTFLLQGKLRNKKIEKVLTRSTTEALNFVLKGRADIGITNDTSYALYKNAGLKFISDKYNSRIVWSIFENDKL